MNAPVWVDGAPSHLWLLCSRREQGTGYGVRHVVMAAWCMVDAVTARARGAAFQLDQLRDQPLVTEQFDLPRVDQGQKVEIEHALGVFARLITDASHAVRLSDPLASVSVASDLRDPVTLQPVSKLGDHGLRRERRPDLADAIKDAGFNLLMSDGKRERRRRRTNQIPR